jgi:hypothetical protein
MNKVQNPSNSECHISSSELDYEENIWTDEWSDGRVEEAAQRGAM